MKKIILIFLFASLPVSISAQWYLQNSGTNENLNRILFLNVNSGWITNSTFNKLYHTSNGGDEWSLYLSSNAIISLYFLNENTGWYASRPFGKIFKTTDGGNNWSEICNMACTEFWSIKFINENTGYALGTVCLDGGKFFKSTDGGVTWNTFQISDSLIFFTSFNIIDNQNIILSSENTLFKTDDGGATWTEISISGDVTSLQFFTPQIGWCLINSNLYKTTDGGYDWTLQAGQVYAYSFVDLNNGWYSSGENIFRTIDGGLSWSQQVTNNQNIINGFYFLNENIGWAVGNNGTILYTLNGGLPVELISFGAEFFSDRILLSWITASEKNNKGFEVQRKIKHSKEWQTLDFINGNGTSSETNSYSYIDKDPAAGKYTYRLKQIDHDGSFTYSYEIEVEAGFSEYLLYQNYPNPFNPYTKIKYSIPTYSNVVIRISDILGNEIETLVDENKPAGKYEVTWRAAGLPSGVYYYHLKADSYIESKKMVLIK